MKNLKKSLALVLAIALVFSLVVFANAEFTDAEDINPKFTDAVGVMNGLEIIQGYDTGAFGPQDTLTRDQGAKIITKIKMGKASSTLPTNQVFDDVAADNWAAPYVAYANSKNIINGYDGKFYPSDKLSGYAFGKMLFVTLGYGQNNEFIGDNWKIAVAEVASDTGLFAGLEDYLSDEPLPREVAAQLAFKALGTPMVQYLKSDDIYKAIDPVKTLAKSVQDLNMTPVPGATDAAGRPTKTYTNLDGSKVIYSTTSEPLYTTTAGHKAAVNANKAWNAIAIDTPLKVNGVAEAAIDTDSDSTPDALYIDDAANNYYVGATIEYYGAPNKTDPSKIDIDHIVVTDYAYAVVTEVKEGSVKLNGGPAITDKVSLKALEGFVVGDKLAVVAKGAVITAACKAEAVTGEKVTAYNTTAHTFKLDGAEQKADYKFIASMPHAIAANSDTFYLSPNGYVIGKEGPGAVETVQTDFAYIVKVQLKKGAAASEDILNPTEAKPYTAKAEVIFTDGSHKAIDLNVYKESNKYWVDIPTATDIDVACGTDTSKTVDVKNWAAYSVGSDGAYMLEALLPACAEVRTGSDLKLEKDKPLALMGTNYTTSATKIVSIDTNYTVKEQTGLVDATLDYDAVPNAVLITKAGSTAKTIAAIYAVGQTATTPPAVKEYAYAIAPGDSVADGTEWTFYIEGAVATRVISSGVNNTDKIYTLEKNPTKDCYAATAVTPTETGVITVVDASFFAIGSNTYTIATTTKVFDVRTGHAGEAATLAANLKVAVVAVSGTAAVAYIVD